MPRCFPHWNRGTGMVKKQMGVDTAHHHLIFAGPKKKMQTTNAKNCSGRNFF